MVQHQTLASHLRDAHESSIDMQEAYSRVTVHHELNSLYMLFIDAGADFQN